MAQQLFALDHQSIFDRVDRALSAKDLSRLREQVTGFSAEIYMEQAKELLAITGLDDPRFDDLLRGRVAANDYEFLQLQQVLSNRCEREYGPRIYKRYLSQMLKALSSGFDPQRFCVAGHMDVSTGYKAVGRHIRIASGKHAINPDTACYMIFDAATPIRWRRRLMQHIQPYATLL
ncbi:MAG: hypothetical protein AAF629_06035 [Chloroflexota bacterium]